MIAVKSILLDRAEGVSRFPDRPQTVWSWEEANRVLSNWSWTAPKNGGYNKCDFTIEFEDGLVYSGRYDLVHYSVGSANLARHVWESQAFLAGRYCPPHMDDKEYESVLEDGWIAEQRGPAEHFLDSYEIPYRRG